MERILAETPPRNAIKFSQMFLPYFSCGVIATEKIREKEREKERKREREKERERVC
jgi:hypothetical protein